MNKGITGRNTPKNLKEKLALEEIMNNPSSGLKIKEDLKDTRWRGWTKMSNTTDHGIEIHYVAKWQDGKIISIDDFKFVDP